MRDAVPRIWGMKPNDKNTKQRDKKTMGKKHTTTVAYNSNKSRIDITVDGYLTAAEITGTRQMDTNDAHAEAWTLAEHVGMSDAEGEGLIQKLNEALAEAYR